MNKRRVVITGLGIITPLGKDKDSFWSALIKGESGIKEIDSFDTSDYSCKTAGRISDFQSNDTRLDRACQLSLFASRQAMKNSSLNLNTIDKQRAGVIMGTTSGTNDSFVKYHKTWLKYGFNKVDPDVVSKYKHEAISNCICSEFGLEGYSILIGTACSAGSYAIGEALNLIRNNQADIILAGGADTLTEFSHCGFYALRSLTKSLCRPFDKNRDGMVVSEGAAVMVLEPLENALKRNADIHAEVIGYGLSCDAEHITAPQTSGESAALCMNTAIKDADIGPENIDYINAHGTGTPLNDLMETNGIKKVFGNDAYKIPVSSIKSMLGHSFGAAGAIEAIACALALKNNIIPPTINYQEPDPQCDLDYVPNKAREKKVDTALSNSFAFGGNNATIILRKYNE